MRCGLVRGGGGRLGMGTGGWRGGREKDEVGGRHISAFAAKRSLHLRLVSYTSPSPTSANAANARAALPSRPSDEAHTRPIHIPIRGPRGQTKRVREQHRSTTCAPEVFQDEQSKQVGNAAATACTIRPTGRPHRSEPASRPTPRPRPSITPASARFPAWRRACFRCRSTRHHVAEGMPGATSRAFHAVVVAPARRET